MQRGLGHRARTVLVAASFHHTGAGRERESEVFLREKIQQVNKRECRSQDEFLVSGFWFRVGLQGFNCRVKIERPRVAGSDAAKETCRGLAEPGADDLEHVDQ